MKRKICFIIICAVAMGLCGCKDNKGYETESTSAEITSSEEMSSEEESYPAETSSEIRQPEKENSPVPEIEKPPANIYTYTNEYGFTMRYDDNLFEKVISGEEGAYFEYKGSRPKGVYPACLNVSVLSEYGINQLTEEIGAYGGHSEKAEIGTDGYSCDKWTYNEETENGRAVHTVYLVSVGEGLTAVLDSRIYENDTQAAVSALEGLVASFGEG